MSNIPYFSVGEEVILISQYYPQCNGEYIILGVRHGDYIDSVTGEIKNGLLYNLGTLDKYGTVDWWRQQSLRKKYPPADEKFTNEIMSVFGSKVEENVK